MTATRVALFVQSQATHLKRVAHTRASWMTERRSKRRKERERERKFEERARHPQRDEEGRRSGPFVVRRFRASGSSESSRVLSSLLLLLRHPQHFSWRTVWQTVLFSLSLLLLCFVCTLFGNWRSHGARSRHSAIINKVHDGFQSTSDQIEWLEGFLAFPSVGTRLRSIYS